MKVNVLFLFVLSFLCHVFYNWNKNAIKMSLQKINFIGGYSK
jgi:hypothetical protein